MTHFLSGRPADAEPLLVACVEDDPAPLEALLALTEMEGVLWLALLWLLLYNVCFILPLVAVFVLLMVGVTSERLTALYQRHLAATKFVTAALFAGLFAWFMMRIT